MKISHTQRHPPTRSPWRSLEQLAESWGLSRTRTNLVVKALVRSGRLEERMRCEQDPGRREFRLVGR